MSRHHIENRDVAIPFVGDFTHFLLQNDGFKTYTKLELKDVYERWKVSRHCKPAPFSTVLEVMEFFFRQIRTDGDLVLFRGTADFEHIGKKRYKQFFYSEHFQEVFFAYVATVIFLLNILNFISVKLNQYGF